MALLLILGAAAKSKAAACLSRGDASKNSRDRYGHLMFSQSLGECYVGNAEALSKLNKSAETRRASYGAWR